MNSSRRIVCNAFAALSLQVLAMGAQTVTANAAPRAFLSGKARTVTIKPLNHREEVQRLMREGYDIAGVNLDKGTVDVIADEREFSTLTSNKSLKVVRVKEFNPQAAPDARYTNYEELTAALREYAEKHPEIVKLESYGKSLQGLDLWAVKISQNVQDQDPSKPVLFFNAMHHAREVMTTEVALDLIDQLTQGYVSGDSRVQNWVDQNEIWIVPMVNPDGNNKVWNSNNMWRKNARGSYGVDINRNYPYKWGACSGSSGSQFAQDYRGPSAASEPETQAMMAFVGRIKPVMSISYHSYSEIVIYPMGCQGAHAPSPDRETIQLIGKQLAGKLVKDSGNGTYKPGTAWELLYPVDGGDIDWYYTEHDVLPYVIEVNSDSQGFQPSYTWRQKTVEKMRKGWEFFLDRVSESGIRGNVRDAGGRTISEGHVTIESLAKSGGDSAALKSYRIKPDGTFHMVIQPGMYKVRVSAEGKNVDLDVTVGAERSDVNIIL